MGFGLWRWEKLNGHYVLSSETCAFDLVQAEFVRELEPGEIVIINEDGVTSIMPEDRAGEKKSLCIFEYIYFARPDSTIYGKKCLSDAKGPMAINWPRSPLWMPTLSCPFPDSGNYSAIGYAEESGNPL